MIAPQALALRFLHVIGGQRSMIGAGFRSRNPLSPTVAVVVDAQRFFAGVQECDIAASRNTITWAERFR